MYEPVTSFEKVEACKIFGGMKAIFFLESIVNIIRSFEGNILDFCHHSGDMKVSNVSLVNSSLVQFLPDGQYRSIFKLFDSGDDNIINVTYYATITR